MEKLKWDKLRMLVTSACNYRCPFCHNEGQEKNLSSMMSVVDFKRFVDIIADEPLTEFNFSGGEPFAHPNICEMIRYACEKLNCDISCASNLSLIKEDQIDSLATTRVKFNVQFPFAEETKFNKSTGNGDMNKILTTIFKLRNTGIEVGLNTVLQSNNEQDVITLILFAIKHEIPLKLLPQIGGTNSYAYKDFVYPILQKYCTTYREKGTGATRWTIKNGDKETVVLYIDSPCFYKDITTCRNFGELRVLPDFSLQSCILKNPVCNMDLSDGKEKIIKQMNEVWKNFKNC